MSEDSKYWIRAGMNVGHVDFPGMRIVVERISRDGERRIDGVECHWVDKAGGYNKGKFFTWELMPFIESVSDENLEHTL